MEEIKLKLLPDLIAKLRIKASEENKSVEQLVIEILEKEVKNTEIKNKPLSKPVAIKKTF